MATRNRNHAFAANPLLGAAASDSSAVATIENLLQKSGEEQTGIEQSIRIVPFRQGKPLVLSSSSSSSSSDEAPVWRLSWQNLQKCRELLGSSEVELVRLGQREGIVYWALDLTEIDHSQSEFESESGKCAFVHLRTLMVGTDWSDGNAMEDLSIAGHARAMLEWNSLSRFCGKCGTKTIPIDAGRRRQCGNSSCKKKIYPRVDPVVIMLVIDRANDRALLSKQSRFVPRMWSCLAGFIEPGESLEEAVRRETLEEVGIAVGEVVYHSSQPWPVGPSSMPCQLMVGFFALAKSFDICVDKKELEDAQWHNREQVKNALTFAEYKKSQRTSALKICQICDGVEKDQSLLSDLNVETGELAPMFVPGPFAIAHHLISSWANEGADVLSS
eukprot:Gb_30389 [translate_table: standard]